MNKQHMINSDSITLLSKSRILYTIPIYFRTLKEWHNKYNHDVKKHQEVRTAYYEKHGFELEPNQKIIWEVEFNRNSTPWKYNEIIGYIELRYLSDALHAFLFFVDADRCRPVMKSKKILLYEYLGIVIPKLSNLSNTDAKKSISDFFVSLKSQNSKIKRYFIDLEEFNNVIDIIDFKNIINIETNTN